MPWTLLPHLSACVAGESVMLLDLRQDRYFRLPEPMGRTTCAWLTGRTAAPPPTLIALLERSGVLKKGDASLRAPALVLTDIPAVLDTPVTPERLGPARALGIARAVAGSWLNLRTRRLHILVAARRIWRASQPFSGDAISPECLAGYHRARRLVPIAKNCLMDSMALDAWLGSSEPGRHLVFGVTVEPFLAHCWLQSPSRILNDNYDHVRRYTPILIV